MLVYQDKGLGVLINFPTKNELQNVLGLMLCHGGRVDNNIVSYQIVLKGLDNDLFTLYL